MMNADFNDGIALKKDFSEIQRLRLRGDDLYREAAKIEEKIFKGFEYFNTLEGEVIIDVYNPKYEDLLRLFSINLPFDVECDEGKLTAIFQIY